MNTALILRPSFMPPVHVLEVDGPRWKYARRGEGCYYLSTCNWPSCHHIELRDSDGRRGYLRDWSEPYWEIYQQHDGSIEIHACRPTIQEVMRGEMYGRWGSTIKLGKQPTRDHLRLGLHLARLLARCIPTEGITIRFDSHLFFGPIETDIPIRLQLRKSPFNKSQSAA